MGAMTGSPFPVHFPDSIATVKAGPARGSIPNGSVRLSDRLSVLSGPSVRCESYLAVVAVAIHSAAHTHAIAMHAFMVTAAMLLLLLLVCGCSRRCSSDWAASLRGHGGSTEKGADDRGSCSLGSCVACFALAPPALAVISTGARCTGALDQCGCGRPVGSVPIAQLAWFSSPAALDAAVKCWQMHTHERFRQN